MSIQSEKKFVLKDSFRYFLIGLTIVLISLLFTGAYNTTEVKVGDIWSSQELIAQAQINLEIKDPVLKSRLVEIQNEYQYLLKKVKNPAQDILNALGNNHPYRDQIIPEVNQIYSANILEDKKQDIPYFILKGRAEKSFLNVNEIVGLDAVKDSLKTKFIQLGIDDASMIDMLKPNLVSDKAYTASVINQIFEAETNRVSIVKSGQSIIKSGERVTAENLPLINAVQGSAKSPWLGGAFSILQYLGYLILTCLIIGVLMLYLKEYFPELYNSVSGVAFVLLWPIFFSFLVFAVTSTSTLSPYILPFCLVPIVVKNFFGERLALFIHIVIVLIASYLSGLGYEFIFIQILAGIVTVLLVSETRRWDQFFKAVILILATYALGFLGINLIQEQGAVWSDLPVFGWLAVNGFLLLLAYPFIPMIERMFGFTSSIRLAELADMNNPLLKELSTMAPGTLQHSLQVANLCEAAADAIGANALLVRTAALYHDIGKLANPQYFIENNPNNNLHAALNNNVESAKIIIGHVTNGLEKAKKGKLPKEIVDFILTHHGTTRVEYFYRNEKNANPDKIIDETIFTYPGPKPRTKEEAILMLADTVEAACKSLKNPSAEELDAFIDKICDAKRDHGQLDNSNLTFSEFKTCKTVMKKLLQSVYHVRIEYPEEK